MLAFGSLSAPRAALLATLALTWLNYLLTARWAQVPGSIHGAKEPWFVAALVAATLAALLPAREAATLRFGRLPTMVGGAAALWLGACFLIWFPPASWTQIPLLDNWPARFQATVDGIALLARGAVVGWQWDFLGGYHTSSDLTVSLTAVAWPWMTLFGPTVGFHVTHALLFVAVPALVYADMRLDGPDPAAPIAAALACLTTANFSYFLLRSGDTNSLAGVVATGLVLLASHACARGVRGAPLALVGGLGLVTYCHAGFFAYAAVFLVLEAVCYRDAARLRRASIAIVAGALIGLPLTWESWRYPTFFRFNNVLYDAPDTFPWLEVLRKIYYNVELLALPNRWFNDFSGLVAVALPLVVWTAWRGEGRARFHAWGALATLALLRLNVPQAGYGFLRPIHMLAFFIGPVLAAFALRHTGTRLRAVTLLVLTTLYVQVLLRPVPHVRDARGAAGPLVDAVAVADGALVLVENHYHRDMIAAPDRTSPPSPFPGNFEALLPAATGRRLYAGVWDGWQWSPWRGQMLANGAWDGRAIDTVPHETFAEELRRWGIRRLFVWSDEATRYLAGDPRFVAQPPIGPWRAFTFDAAEASEVVVAHGSGRLVARDPLGARIRIDAARAGDAVIVRTNYHPVWQATWNGQRVAVRSAYGQLAVDAPATGPADLVLTYPRRPRLLALAGLALIAGTWLVRRQTTRDSEARRPPAPTPADRP